MLGWDEDPRGLRYPECNDDQLGSDMDVGSNSNTELGAVGLRSCWQEITTTVTVAQIKKKITRSRRTYIHIAITKILLRAAREGCITGWLPTCY